MKEYWLKLKEWHAALEGREKHAVNIGGAALMFAVLYFGIWSPFLNRVSDLRTRFTAEQKTLAWMKSADQKIAALAGNNYIRQNTTPVAMLAVLQGQIQKAGIKDALSEMKQGANDSIELQFKNVAFDQLMKLLIAVVKANHVTITQFTATADAAPGQIDAEVTLSLV